ncbi:MAG: transcription-repair coupling factor [Desulfobulbaceae bacterium]|nr:transcription-repair coupling factor [Desulfobulbaceae bacterium]
MFSTIKRLQDSGSIDICGLRGGSSALFLARTAAILGRSVCAVLSSEEQLEILAQDISLFTGAEVLVYPSFEIPPFTPLSPDPATVGLRLATLHRLMNLTAPCIILTSTEALLRRILPKTLLGSRSELVIRGEEIDREELVQSLVDSGYDLCSMVQHEGDLAVRGSIIDIFAPASHPSIQGPIRLDFFGDTVDSIRIIDPVSQRSLSEIEDAVLLPASDILFPAEADRDEWQLFLEKKAAELSWPREDGDYLQTRLADKVRFTGIEFSLPLVYEPFHRVETLFDYLPDRTVLAFLEPDEIANKARILWDRIEANYAEARSNELAVLPPRELFLNQQEIAARADRHACANLLSLPDPDRADACITLNLGDHNLLSQELEIHRKNRGNLAPLADRLLKWSSKGETTLVGCRSRRQIEHLQEILAGYRIPAATLSPPLDPESLPRDNRLHLIEHKFSKGFDLLDEKIHVLSAAELFGEKRLRADKPKRSGPKQGMPILVEELSAGDIVVHRDHGLGKFLGLFNMEFLGRRGDYMQIEYRGGDKLYVPVDRLHWISRYQGLTDQQPALDQLGSNKWLNTKNKVKEAVWKIAQELLEIYARRKIREGTVFSRPGELYQELEQSFSYDETSGQLKAIDEVINDLESPKPMDRLICGDVGYGKTEVAARAAFKVIEDGYQVAVLVPTTVLAEQHAATFRDRFASFPVRIACLNRFRTPAQQKEIVRDLAAGRTDLVIGTHRLLSKDIVYHKLGLLIVDEEHRFGVTHKEKIKKIKAEVDVLTLTATPIPRTLQMSLLGIRDLSVITTPPRQRRSVKTFLARYDDLVIREAVHRELQRGGQIFFVHNRVRSITRLARKIEKLIPQARIAVAHGQMPGRVLEEIMVRFINHEIDVLICTTIIESGLDIPNANTIIINRADQLGLADIYQLRGRVGRSSRQSYAYLLVPSLESLTKDAKKRLQALMDCNELGGGFKLAMNDLQIRGGGNLLGVSQSGHIAAVGYDLYLDLLQSTVADLQRRAAEDRTAVPDIDPEINLKLNAYIPDTFISDATQRYHMYQRISAAGVKPAAELDDLRAELVDRYGAIPPETENLLAVIGVKYRLRQLGIAKLEQAPDSIVFSFIKDAPVDSQAIVSLISSKPKKKQPPIRLTPDNRLIVPWAKNEDVIAPVHAILDKLSDDRVTLGHAQEG